MVNMEDIKLEEISRLKRTRQIQAYLEAMAASPQPQPQNNGAVLLFQYGEMAKGMANGVLSKSSTDFISKSKAPATQLGSSSHQASLGSSWPNPAPPSGAPSPVIQSNDATNIWGTGYLDQLAQFISYLKNNPNDPRGLQNFMQFVANLAAAGDMTSDVVATLNEAGANQLLQIGIIQGMETAFFSGYNGQNGQAGAQAYLNDLISNLSGFPQGDSFIQFMTTIAQGQLAVLPFFTSDHTAANGDLIWTFNGVTYDWSNPTQFGDDQNMISQIINNQGITGDPNSAYDNLDLNSFLRDYRLRALIQLLQEFAGHPEIAICLWTMTVYDNQFQSEQGGLASTTNLLTTLTNSDATPLLTLAQKMGTLTDSDATQFEDLFFNTTNLINLEGQTESIASQWNANVYQIVGGISSLNLQVTVGGQSVTVPSSVTLLQVMTGATVQINGQNYTFTLHDLTNALNGFFVPPPSGGTTPSTSPGYQTILDALQQGGSLITGTSKTVATALSTVANTDNEVIKFGHSVVDPTGGGLIQLQNKIIDNQISH